MEIDISIAQPARKSGGDKYEGEYEGEKVSPYLPQKITRKNGKIRENLVMVIYVKSDD